MFMRLIVAATAAATSQPITTPETVEVFMSPTVILPEPMSGKSTVTAGPEELMWRAGLGFEEVATVGNSVSAEAGGMSRIFDQNTALWRARPRRDTINGQPFRGRLYCGVRSRKNGPDLGETSELILRTDASSRSDPRLCLLDEDSDGVFDHGVAVGRLKLGPSKVAIPLTPYQQIKDFVLPTASVQFRPIRGGPLQGPQISFDVFIADRRIVAAAMHMMPKGGTQYRRVYSERSIKNSSYPAILPFGDMKVTVLAYEPSTRSVTARLDEGFYRTPVYFEAVGPRIIAY